jgi:hypothetical protein
MKKVVVSMILLGFIGAMVFVIFIKPTNISNERIILEHTYKTYITPACFEESNPTNFLEESTLEVAEEKNYKPHSDCTVEALKAESSTMYQKFMNYELMN